MQAASKPGYRVVRHGEAIPEIAGLIVGVDEAGRGPLVGNVVAAAVILDPSRRIVGLADSKKLSEKKREQLAQQIKECALAWAVASVSPTEIDQLNILWASMQAMSRAVNALATKPDHALIDGNRCPNDLPCTATAVIKGDDRVAAISAASILAKVERDRQMAALHLEYPQYGFDQHKGYPTKVHLRAIAEHGICSEHRLSYGPVRMLINAEA